MDVVTFVFNVVELIALLAIGYLFASAGIEIRNWRRSKKHTATESRRIGRQ